MNNLTIASGTQSDAKSVPFWAWRTTQITLVGLLVMGALVVVVLASGAADPHGAGPPVAESGPLPEMTVPVRSNIMLDKPIQLPAPPFTLDVTGQFSADSDPTAQWGLQVKPVATWNGSGIIVDGYRFLAILPGDLAPFIHVRAGGEANKLTLDVDSDLQATWRINDEIAWSGIIPQTNTPHLIRILVHGGVAAPSRFTVQRITLFAPSTSNLAPGVVPR